MSVKSAAATAGIGFGSARLFLKGIELPDEVRLQNIAKAKNVRLYTEVEKTKVCTDYLVSSSVEQTSLLNGLSVRQTKYILHERGVVLPADARKRLKSLAMRQFYASPGGGVANKKKSESMKASWLAKSAEDQVAQVAGLRGAYATWFSSLSREEKLELMQLRQSAADAKNLAAAGVATWGEYFAQLALPDGTTVLSPYTGTFGMMTFQCSAGHNQYVMRANNFQQGQRCPTCSAGRHASRAQLEILEYVRTFYPSADTGRVGALELDIWVPEVQLGIEYNGLLWHSTKVTELYGVNPIGKHYAKYRACLDGGINLFAVYEDEWESKKDLIKAMIRWRLKKFSGQKLNARDLEVRPVLPAVTESFFEANHIDGYTLASRAWGLFSGDLMVSCVSVRNNFNGEVEIARLATDWHYAVPGAAARLISRIPDRPLISFSNNRLSSGGVYKTLGFKQLAENRPSYWYTDCKVRIWRWRCRRRNDSSTLASFPGVEHTEAAQALAGVFSENIFGDRRPLYKIEDYGHRKWVLP